MSLNRICALALAGALTLSLSACGGDTSAEGSASGQEAPAGVAVQVREVGLDTIATENRVSGRVVADSQTAIMVAATAKCTKVYVEAGDHVEQGDPICTLDLDSTLASQSAAQIGYDAAVQGYEDQKAILDKQIAMARENVENLKALFEIGAASQLEIDSAELTLQQAEAGRDSALAQLEAAMHSGKANLKQLAAVLENVDSKGNVVAPVSGTLVSLSAVEEGFVSPSMPVAVIDGAEQMKIAVSVSEALVPKLAIGDEAQVTVSAVDATFAASVRSVEQTASMQTRLYTVILSVPAEVGGLLSGMSADVVFRTDTSENAVVVPTEAIMTSNGVQYVYIVEDGAAKYVEVTTGLNGNGVTEVLTGLSAGQQLVTVGQTYLSDGDPVRVVGGEG